MPKEVETTFFRKEEEIKKILYDVESFFKYGRKWPPDKFVMYMVMQEMGWDYETYLRQPDDLVQLIELIVVGRKQAEIKESKKHGKGRRP